VDEQHIRAQSTISDKNNTKPFLPLSGAVFLVRIRFSSVPKTRLARRARNLRSRHMPAFATPLMPGAI
jgi:hypothetical protein